MNPERMIFTDTPAFIPVPEALQHRKVEVILWPLDEETLLEPLRKRTPPPHFAGRVKEVADVMQTLSAEDWGMTE